MRFSAAITFFVATLVAAAPAPADLSDKSDIVAREDGGAIATCETATAAEHVKCIDACGKDAACITAWYVISFSNLALTQN